MRPRWILALCWAGCAPLNNDPLGSGSSIPDNELTDSAPPPSECEVLGYWPFDEGSGDVAADASGNGRDLEIKGATWWDGVYKWALSFDGINDRAYTYDAGLQDLTAVTITAWVYSYANEQSWIAGTGGEVSWYNPYGLLAKSGGEFGMILSDGDSSNMFDYGTFTEQQWTHLAGTVDGSTGAYALYRDGELVYEGSVPYRRFPDMGGPFSVGRDYNETGWDIEFKGFIDEVKVVSCALGAEEIARDYQTNWFWER